MHVLRAHASVVTIPMLHRTSDSLERFVRAVHRRQAALRLVERTGVGILGASAVATVLVGVMVWRGQDAWTIAAVTLGAGALFGAIWGLSARPSRLAAANEADRQLGRADLFATAWAVKDRADDPWARTV